MLLCYGGEELLVDRLLCETGLEVGWNHGWVLEGEEGERVLRKEKREGEEEEGGRVKERERGRRKEKRDNYNVQLVVSPY